MKYTTTIDETPVEALRQALGGDAGAKSRVLSGPLSRAQILIKKRSGKGWRLDDSLAAAQNYLVHGKGAGPRADSPASEWAKREHCPVDGALLVNGRNIDLELDYREASRELRLKIRMLAGAGRLGATVDDQADRAEEIIDAGKVPDGGRFWRRCVDYLSSTRPTGADESWLDDGPPLVNLAKQGQSIRIGGDQTAAIAIGGIAAGGNVHIGGDCVGSKIVTGSTRRPGGEALGIWREKKAMLEGELALVTDAAEKFRLGKMLEEAKAKIYDLEAR